MHCKAELDIYSGQQNPFVLIPQEDFDSLLDKICHFESQKEDILFNGLGFRGVVIACKEKRMVIQETIVKTEINNQIQFMKCPKDFLFSVLKIFDKYDIERKYDIFRNRLFTGILWSKK